MRWSFALLVLHGVVGCYRPALEESCSVRCDLSSGCPGAQECADGFCRAPGIACGSDGGIVDVPLDQGQQTDGLFCYGTGQAPFTSVCFIDPPNMTRNFAGTLNTMTDCDQFLPQNGGPDFCVITAGTFTLGSVRTVGPRVLLVFATDSVVVNGELSVAGSLLSASGSLPAGSSSCTAASGGAGDDSLNYGGGGGGSGGRMGGSGGSPSSGLPSAPQSPLVVQGGCSGGQGGASSTAMKASGGFGGGAVYLMAGNQIKILGSIDASGSGGAGGGLSNGGGGGGAGGMIVLDAPAIMIDPGASIFALGGGGGGGGSTTTPGGPGGPPSGPNAPGIGGNGATRGGNGGVFDADAGENAGIGDGGGGGGGGGGIIRMSPPPMLGSMNVSPPAT